MIKSILITLFAWSFCFSKYAFSGEECDPYSFPVGCLGQSAEVISDYGFTPYARQIDQYNLISTSPDENPLGLHVVVFVKNEIICAIRYSISTHKYSTSMIEFDKIKEGVISEHVDSPWIDYSSESSHGAGKIYNDGVTRINISRASILFVNLSKCD